MRKLSVLARKIAERVARRLGGTSGPGGPLPGVAGRAAPGERRIFSEARPKKLPAAVGRSALAASRARAPEPLPGAAGTVGPGAESQLRDGPLLPPLGRNGKAAVGRSALAASRARMKVAPEPLPGAAGTVGPGAESQSREGPLLPPLGRNGKAAEGKLSPEMIVREREALAMKNGQVVAEGLTSPTASTSLPPPPPRADSEFWYKFMLLAGSSLGFLIHFIKGYVDKEVDLRMTRRDCEEKAKTIKEKDEELQLKNRELALATEQAKGRRWFGH